MTLIYACNEKSTGTIVTCPSAMAEWLEREAMTVKYRGYNINRVIKMIIDRFMIEKATSTFDCLTAIFLSLPQTRF
jgi:hypothetical protein